MVSKHLKEAKRFIKKAKKPLNSPCPIRRRFYKVSIKPAPISMKDAIRFYKSLNDRGRAEFTLTLREENRKPFLDALEEHNNNLGKPKNARNNTA